MMRENVRRSCFSSFSLVQGQFTKTNISFYSQESINKPILTYCDFAFANMSVGFG